MARLMPFNKGNSLSRSFGFKKFYNNLDNFFKGSIPAIINLTNDEFKLDIEDRECEYIIQAELPGIKKEEINLELNNGWLIISVDRKEEEKNYIHQERDSSMIRSLYLGEVNEKEIDAKLEEGILYISASKKRK